MSVSFMYSNPVGRLMLKGVLHSGVLKIAAVFMNSSLSRPLIRTYIRNNGIDMSSYPERRYDSFGDFFSRRREDNSCDERKNALISPCDSLLSIYPIESDSGFSIKGSRYRVCDLVPDEKTAAIFDEGLCCIFRLRASDYHRFCYVDDCRHGESHFVPGLLHSVQPIACESVPVYRLNRRLWTLLHTENFGSVAQIEVGALLVGGMAHEKARGEARKGEEMGHFELAGSTIVLLLTKDVRDSMKLLEKFEASASGEETEIRRGEAFAVLKEAKK